MSWCFSKNSGLTRFAAAAAILSALAAIVSLPACMTITPPHPMPTDPTTAKDWLMPAWPQRDIEWAQAIAPSVQGAGSMVAIYRGVVRDGLNLVPVETKRIRRVDGYTLTETGVVFQIECVNPTQCDPADREAAGLLFVSKPMSGEGADVSPVTAGTGKQPSEVLGTYVRMAAPLNDPDGSDSDNGEPAGIVVHLEGLAGVQYEQPVIDALRKRGYIELRTPFPWSRWKPITLELKTDDDLWHVASALGIMADDCLGEAAYAVEAAVNHLQRVRPELQGKPVVLIGFSAGSLALPAVAARLGDRVSAAVIAGSGANIVHISQTSELTDGGIKVMAFGRPATGAMAGLLSGAYLRRCTLDPYHAAALMRHYPVLQIQAASDDIVPASLGEDLYERLGRPERWTIPGGHRRLFLQMTPKSDKIANWVLDAVKNPQKPMNGNGGSLLKPK